MRALEGAERSAALQLFANYPLFEHAEPGSLQHLVRAATFARAAAGERILEEGSPASSVFFVLEGAARIYHGSDDGREFTPKILAAPNHFGDLELIAGFDWNGQSVELLTESLVAVVPWEAIRVSLLSDHQLAIGWLVGLASQFVHTIDADRHHVFTGLPGRIANVLLSYGDVFGRPMRDGIEVGIELSREQIARQVGSVRRAVLRVIQTFSEKGLIETRGRHLVLRDRLRLQAELLPRRLGIGHRARSVDRLIKPR